MKIIYNIFMVLSVITFFGCEDDLDQLAATDFEPGILKITPGENSRVVQGKFESINAYFVDGTVSPLAEGTIVLLDESGAVITEVKETLTGTADSIVVEGSTFGGNDLALGAYTLKVSATDTKGQTVTKEHTFEISSLPFPANNNVMYIAGEFNGWGFDQMELVDEYTWEIKEVDLKAGPWKFKNTTDWTDKDWGDPGCDGEMEETTGGGPNTSCGFTGLVNIRFNDETLKYTVVPSVSFEGNVTALYLLGNFNQFEGEEYEFTQTANNMWELAEIRLKEGDIFKFSESPSFAGKNYGDNEPDSIADLFGSNIVLSVDYADAFYKITFNDESLEYHFELLRYPYPDNFYLVGTATLAGDDPSKSISFKKTEEGIFEIFTYLVAGEFKMLEVQDWAGDWGKGAEGELVQDGESNIAVASDGFYRIKADLVNKTYEVIETNWAIVGDATPGGWGTDTDMVHSGNLGDYSWTISNVTLTTGEMKFRANDGWDINMGDNDADGTLEYGGSNINVTSGTYTITLTLDPVNGYSYTIN